MDQKVDQKLPANFFKNFSNKFKITLHIYLEPEDQDLSSIFKILYFNLIRPHLLYKWPRKNKCFLQGTVLSIYKYRGPSLTWFSSSMQLSLYKLRELFLLWEIYHTTISNTYGIPCLRHYKPLTIGCHPLQKSRAEKFFLCTFYVVNSSPKNISLTIKINS